MGGSCVPAWGVVPSGYIKSLSLLHKLPAAYGSGNTEERKNKGGVTKDPKKKGTASRRGEGTKQRRETISKNCEYDADEVDDDEVAEIAAKAWKFLSQSYEDSFISSQHL